MYSKKSKMEGGFDSCRFDFRIDTKNGLTPSRRKKIERRTGYNTLFKCKTCGSLFDSRPALLTHKLTHNPVNEWTCPICECQSAGKMTLEQHLRKTHCIGSAPSKKLSGKSGKATQFNLTTEEIQAMVKNSETQAQLNNIKVYEDEIITTKGSPVPEPTPPVTFEKELQRPLLAPITTAATISGASAAPIAPPGMVCVNVPIYIGPQGARPLLPQNPFNTNGNPPAGMIQVMPNIQGGQFVSALPQAQFTQPQTDNQQTLQHVVKLEPQDNSQNNNFNGLPNLVQMKPRETSPTVEIKKESPEAPSSHVDDNSISELNKSGINTENQSEEVDEMQERPLAIDEEVSSQPTSPLDNSLIPVEEEHASHPQKSEIQENVEAKRSLEEVNIDREDNESPRLKKPKLGCINMTVEKLWQNRKRNDENAASDEAKYQYSESMSNSVQNNLNQDAGESNVAPIVIEPLQTGPQSPGVVYEDDEYFVPQLDVDPNRLPSAIHLEIKEQYMQYARGRKRKVKDPYCTAMFHACRICKQLFDSSEKMWAHMLTHEEMYCKSDQVYQCEYCKFTTDSESSFEKHKLDEHGENTVNVSCEEDVPLNLTVPKENSPEPAYSNYQVQPPQKRNLLTGSRLFTITPTPPQEVETYQILPERTAAEEESDQMWECDFCDFISTESYQVVKQHMADVHGYYMDVISHRPQGNSHKVPFVPLSVTSSGKGHVITLDPNQVQNQDLASDCNSNSELLPLSAKVGVEEQSGTVIDMHGYSPNGMYGNAKREVEKSSDMQEEAGFFHYSKKQWRHMTQNQTNISIQDAVQSDEPMETTFHMCKICKKLFNTIWDKWEHNYLVHRESHCKLHCPWCNFVSFSRKKLQKHVEVAHPDVNEADSAPDGKPHVCEICGNTYVSLVHYRLHLLKHGENGPPVFQCPYDSCQMKYHTKSGLRNHMKRVHMDSGTEEQQTCPFEGCGKQFSANGMKRHLVCHSDERPVLCKYPGCGQSFREVKHLRVHWLQHTDEKPLSCEICDYTCRQRSSMNWHMKSRHGLSKVTGSDGKTTYA